MKNINELIKDLKNNPKDWVIDKAFLIHLHSDVKYFHYKHDVGIGPVRAYFDKRDKFTVASYRTPVYLSDWEKMKINWAIYVWLRTIAADQDVRPNLI